MSQSEFAARFIREKTRPIPADGVPLSAVERCKALLESQELRAEPSSVETIRAILNEYPGLRVQLAAVQRDYANLERHFNELRGAQRLIGEAGKLLADKLGEGPGG